jgi:hypothetical protein
MNLFDIFKKEEGNSVDDLPPDEFSMKPGELRA